MKYTCIADRMKVFQEMFEYLSNCPSRNEKQAYIVRKLSANGEEFINDFNYCIEILDGRHKLGFTFVVSCNLGAKARLEDKLAQDILQMAGSTDYYPLKEFLKPLYQMSSHGEYEVRHMCSIYYPWAYFLKPLLNREWRLGIGKSLLEKDEVSPMLSKKFDVDKEVQSSCGYYITEKLDGNRCIAKFSVEKAKWEFFSRSGKQLKVSFNMGELPENLIYDGEILSIDQIHNPGQANFNSLSGTLNSKYQDKSSLIYTIFDIPNADGSYKWRRMVLDVHKSKETSNVRILPVRHVYKTWEELCEHVFDDLEEITSVGGEGVMINVGSRFYEQKRTDALMKLKKVQTMDMRVTGLTEGTGKHEGLVGALLCDCKDEETGAVYECKVGSGLSDEQRWIWASDPDRIIGKIVEVAYFSISQDKSARGSKLYSLRFPRLKKVRSDKNSTSVF